jgi:hypothetical protein
VVGAVAAACLLAVLAWHGRGKGPAPGPEERESAQQVSPAPPDEVDIPAWLEGRRTPKEEEPAPFAWPLEEPAPVTVTVSTSIPPDLFD